MSAPVDTMTRARDIEPSRVDMLGLMAMCDDCVQQTTASKNAAPHGKLVLESARDVSTMFGSADERYYRCRDCGQFWLSETGSAGSGWVTLSN